MRIKRLQHVSTPYPRGRHSQVREFYGGVLGLEEKRQPESLAGRELVWYEAGGGEDELHFLPEDAPSREQAGRAGHFCLEVDDLAGCRQRLERAGCETRDATPIPARPRFFSRDPFGNEIEFTTIIGDYRQSG